MSRLLLFSVLFFSFFFSVAADFHRTINWYPESSVVDTIAKVRLDFAGSVKLNRTGLPYWFESFELESSSADVLVKDAVFEPVNVALVNIDAVKDSDLLITREVGSTSGKSFLRLSILPFVKRNGRIEKLVSFTVSIKETVNQLKSAQVGTAWKSSSVLSSGKWVKVKLTDKGIYKITYDQLKQWGFTNPDIVSLYGNGGYMLPTPNSAIQPDDLSAYPIWKGKDSSGKDCFFFYSTGNIEVRLDKESSMYSHQQNYYSTATYFYLTDQGTSLAITKSSELTQTAGRSITSYPNYVFYEKELVNLLSSGSRWLGERFSQGSSLTINLNLENPDLTKSAGFVISAVGKSSSYSSMNIALNGKSDADIVFNPVNDNDSEAKYADAQNSTFSDVLTNGTVQAKLTYTASNSLAVAWLDYISVNYQSQLTMLGDVYSFRGTGSEGSVAVSEFILGGATSGTKIFDVTDFHKITEVPATFLDGKLKFKSNSSDCHEYIAFNPAGTIPSPELVGSVSNQNLHAAELAEMIIVSDPALISAANDLAEFHRTSDLMTVQVLTPEVIYNEFSGGLPDPSGLRNYFRMCYDKGKKVSSGALKYILFLGDGSYDNRNVLKLNHNAIPTYQSEESFYPTESFVTDDFFAFLDENEGGAVGTVDLGVGRIPAPTLEDAEVVVDKIKNYQRKETLGNWRNVISFIADDEDSNVHMIQAEGMANYVNAAYPAFYTEKIYFDSYTQLSTPAGEKYPEVTAAINNRVKQGGLLINYTGHANAKSLAAEKVLDISTISSWTNSLRLPVFVTATCEFSRFDDDDMSAGEHILFKANGGGIGLFSTTRVVYSGENSILNNKFFNYVFEKDQSGNRLRLGDVMRLAKASSNTGINQLNFSLLADPAIRLAYPSCQIKTESIDGKNVTMEADTIRPLTAVKVKGYVTDNKGAKLTTFNGEIIPTVYDKAMQVETLGNAGQKPMSYKVQGNIIYRGLADVKNGEFEFSFFVPKDISYKLDKGKILYYAYNESIDAQGYFDNFYIGGSSNTTISDSKGPDVQLFMNSESFVDGGTVSASSVLLANITDDTGINTAGAGIGHDITAVLDGDYSKIMILNDYFQADKNSYNKGQVVFPLTDLTEGEHTLIVKVWDVMNNSSEKEIHFVVKDDFRIEKVSCFPNPMTTMCNFTFTHNQPDETFDVSLEVFQTNGLRIDLFQTTVGSNGTESYPFEWNPADRLAKMAPGVYVYRITVSTNDGKKSYGTGRLLHVYK